MTRLTRNQVLLLHEQMLSATGGRPGVHDPGLLDSALAVPYAGWDDEEFYPSIQSKAARLAYGIISNHPFHDGNKRTGVQAMLVLLYLNGIQVEATTADLVSLGLGLADGTLSSADAHDWIIERELP